ncbi:ASCH domain-containing protein, partial [Vibrio parahaemolyticus]|nr:ASCH domain-containing protein [Vibrio parahaemolyticus]
LPNLKPLIREISPTTATLFVIEYELIK